MSDPELSPTIIPASAVISCRAHTVDAWWVRFHLESVTPPLPIYMRLIHPEGTQGSCNFCTAPGYFYFDT